MNISVTGRDAKPRVINVKQYSSGVDDIIFTIEADLPTGDINGCMISDKYRQTIDFTPSVTGGIAQWHISSVFTQTSGAFNIQLELTDGTSVWRSDVMLLIVSESTNGTTNAPATDTADGTYQTIYAKINLCNAYLNRKELSDRLFNNGTVFQYEAEN